MGTEGHSPEFGPATKLQRRRSLYCVACNTHFGIGHGGRHDVKRHIEWAAHIAGCEIDKVIFIAMHKLPMAVGDDSD